MWLSLPHVLYADTGSAYRVGEERDCLAFSDISQSLVFISK